MDLFVQILYRQQDNFYNQSVTKKKIDQTQFEMRSYKVEQVIRPFPFSTNSTSIICLLFRYGDEYVTKYDRSSLRKLGSVGEPINNVSQLSILPSE